MKTTLDFINQKTNSFKPEIGIVLGSGLGDFAQDFSSVSIPYSEIPGFGNSTVVGHSGKLIFAQICGKNVVMMQGRCHFYEGHPMEKVVFPIKVMKKLGVKTLILTNAAGAVNKKLKPADLVLIEDHINFMGTNPLIGINDDELGPRFPDMSEIYKKRLIATAQECAKEVGINIKKGIYVAMTGPSYETPAEIRMLRTIGADVVGMSTVPEAIIANYCGIDVLGISCVSNYAAGVQKTPLTHTEVIETTDIVKDKFKSLLLKLLEKL